MLLLHLLFWDISILYSEELFIVQQLMSNIQEDMCNTSIHSDTLWRDS